MIIISTQPHAWELAGTRMTPCRCQDPMIKGRRRALRWRLLRFGVGFPPGRHFLSSSLSLCHPLPPCVLSCRPLRRRDVRSYQNEPGNDRLCQSSLIFAGSKNALDNPTMTRCSSCGKRLCEITALAKIVFNLISDDEERNKSLA